MFRRMLASMSDTPKFEAGMRAFDIEFKTQRDSGTTVVVTYGNETIGNQIRDGLYSEHPNAIDYHFKEFDYLEFQIRVIAHQAIDMVLGKST